ncbi:hypothetical protein BZZ01_04885 [Nostocales cyanobacterium HT-58-2]|nr:hypothetical protein BZZ01_04885 [Nostocales cyanobacterium HT-58-2]
MSSVDNYIRKWTGIIGLTITDLTSGAIRAGRLPTNAVIDDNADIEKITGTDSLGRETNIGSNVKAFKPVLTLTYSGANLDLYALQRGRAVNRLTFDDLMLPKEMQVTKSLYAGATTGKVGFGVAEDAVTKASIIGNNLDVVPLTQQPFDTFAPARDNSFAIGENFARKFSDDLVAARAFVQIEVPLPTATSARAVSEESLGAQSINMLVKSTNDTVTLVKIPTAQIDPSGSRFDPKADTIEVKFDLSGLGTCEPYKVYELASKIYCDA